MNLDQLYEQAQQLIARNNHDEAYKILRRLDSAVPNHPGILYLTGVCQSKSGRKENAIASYRKALNLMPNFVEAMNNLGLDLMSMNQAEDAIGLFNRALHIQPGFNECALNKANALTIVGNYAGAIAILSELLEKQPDDTNILVNIGRAFSGAKKDSGALEFYAKALYLKPDAPDIKAHIVTSLSNLRRWKEAIKTFEEIPDDAPEKQSCAEAWINAKFKINDFSVFELDHSYLEEKTHPLTYLYYCETISSQLKNAQNFSSRYLATKNSYQKLSTTERIRVGYLSSDLREHAISYLTAGMFELHNKQKFDIFGISLGPEVSPDSPYSVRIQKSCQGFLSIYGLSTEEAVKTVRALNLDIVVDLNGHTAGARTDVLALRVAPIQISYLGFPGTMGATFIDYIIGDPIITPSHLADQYSEKILTLPDCFQVNDSQREIGHRKDKEFYGLPRNSIVLGCFNQPSKVTAKILQAWANTLSRLPLACLWLLRESDVQSSNILDAAISCGIPSEKIFFADKLSYPEHLARYKVMDLALDTFPFNGGTTTSDALWSGTPVLTMCGETYASRMSATLLHSVGLDELVTNSLAEYESRLFSLASQKSELTHLRMLLEKKLPDAPAFDTSRITQHLERGFEIAIERHRAGLVPDHISVPTSQPN